MTFLLALLGVAFAALAVRAALAGRVAPAWPGTLAVTVVAILGAAGFAGLADALERFGDERDKWSPLTDAEAVDNVGTGVDPAFTRWVKSQLQRGDRFWVSSNAPGEIRLWLNYRLAPNLSEDRPEDADWVLYWRVDDPLREFGISPDEVEQHLEWERGIGLIRRRRDAG